MSENNYGALMMKSALPTSQDLKSVVAPGCYPVIAGNPTAPGKLAGSLRVLPTTGTANLLFSANDGNTYKPTPTGWIAFGETKSVNGHQPDSSGAIAVTSQDIFDGQSVYLGESADLNSYTTPGLYYQPANTGATAGKNYPEPNAGSLVIYKHAGITQVYRIYNTSRSYVRTMYAGVWSAWVMQYDKENRPTAAEVGAVSANGGAYTGDLGMSKFYTHAVEGGNATYLYTPPGPYPAYSMVSCNAYNWYGTQILAGLIRGTSQDVLGWGVMVNGSRVFHVNSGGNACAASGVYESGGAVRVYSPNNPQPVDTSWVAGSQWVMENFLTNAVLGAEGFFDQQGGATTWTFKAPAGCMLTGMIARYTGSNSAHNIGGLYYKPILIARNNTWVQIGG